MNESYFGEEYYCVEGAVAFKEEGIGGGGGEDAPP